MNISLQNIGKRFRKDWIFKNLNYEFESENNYVVIGQNGSGKSTLLKIISGILTPTKGEIIYRDTEIDNIYKEIAIASPYLDINEHLTLKEHLDFHQKFKSFLPEIDTQKALDLMQLDSNKPIQDFSSGMKQKTKLALAIFSQSKVLLLDEPTSNLDAKNIEWYQQMIGQFAENRLKIVFSNELKYEYEFCNKQMNLHDFK